MGRGLAEQLGAVDPKGRGFGLSRADLGLDVTDYIKFDKFTGDRQREKLPAGHRFFADDLRELNARRIDWMMSRRNVESWFVTLTFKNFITENRARGLMKSWLYSLTDAYGRTVLEGKEVDRGHGLKWVAAQEWQKRHVIHFHLILSGVRLGSLSRMRWENRWSGMKVMSSTGEVYFPCGFARIYDARTKAAPYLAKYVGKTDDPGSALEWGGSWQGDRVPDSLRRL